MTLHLARLQARQDEAQYIRSPEESKERCEYLQREIDREEKSIEAAAIQEPAGSITKIPDAPDTRHAIYHSAEFERGVMSRLEWTDALHATYFALFGKQAPESMKACDISHAIVDFKLEPAGSGATHGWTGTCCENGNMGQPHICCKSPGNLPPNVVDLRTRMFKLDRLLLDPHPGLSTWVAAYGNAARHLLQFFDEANAIPDAPGSPRKVGEDGARCNAPNPDGRYLCNEQVGHPGDHVHSFINPDKQNDFYFWPATAQASSGIREALEQVATYLETLSIEHSPDCSYGATHGPHGDFCDCGLKARRGKRLEVYAVIQEALAPSRQGAGGK